MCGTAGVHACGPCRAFASGWVVQEALAPVAARLLTALPPVATGAAARGAQAPTVALQTALRLAGRTGCGFAVCSRSLREMKRLCFKCRLEAFVYIVRAWSGSAKEVHGDRPGA